MVYPFDDPLDAFGASTMVIPRLDLPPAPGEEEGYLAKAGRKALGGLGFVGSTLDKLFGGRALRGILGGRPSELLSLIPGSDVAGLTDQANAVSGEDILKNLGILEGEGEKGTFELRDLAGPLLEAALDPGTFLTGPFGGALTKAGLAAKKSGTLAPKLAERIAKGQASLFGLGVPFMEPSINIGTGPLAQKIAAKAGGYLDKAMYSLPGRSLSALFDPAVEGFMPEYLQRASRKYAPAREAAEVAAEKFGLEQARILEQSNKLTPQAGQEIYDILEGVTQAQPNTAIGEVSENLKKAFTDRLRSEQAVGLDVLERPGYAPRQLREAVKKEREAFGGRSSASPLNPNMIKRREELADLPTSLINQMAATPEISGAERTLAKAGGGNLLEESKYIRDKVLNFTTAMEAERAQLNQALQAGKTLTKGQFDRANELNALYKQGDQLASFMAQLSPEAREGLFSTDILKASVDRLARGGKSEVRAKMIQEILGNVAQPFQTAPADWVPLTDALKAAGLKNYAGATATAGQGLAGLPKGMAAFLSGGQVADFRVPKSTVNELTRYVQGFTEPESLRPFLTFWDSALAMFKAGTTALWPKTRMRNLTQGMFQNFVRMDPSSWVQSTRDAYNVVRHGGVIEDAPQILGKTIPAEMATKELMDEFSSMNGFFRGKGSRAAEEIGGVAQPRQLPGEGGQGPLEILREAIPGKETWKPWEIAGIGGREETKFAPVVASRKLDDLVDDTNRFALYLGKRREGYAPQAAFADVIKAHYDFKNATGFEKTVMSRLIPFYRWQRQNLPRTLEELVTRPSGGTALAAKTTVRSREDQGFIPDYIGEGIAIPIGKEEDGTQRYLSRLGLGFEEAFEPLAGGGRAALGDINPLLQLLVEQGTGIDLRTGRKLEDLYRSPTENQLFNELFSKSPLTRFATTGRTLADERKGILTKAFNLLSPAAVTDVDMAKQKDIAIREATKQELAGDQNVGKYEKLYVKKENLGKLTPEQVQLLRLNRLAEQRTKERAKKEKEKKAVAD